MNYTKDLHLCGICKKIFSDLNFFLEHKSQCSAQNSVVFSPNPHDVSLDNGLFCNEAVLDLTVLDSGSFLPILNCENEEIVSDAADLQPAEQILQKSSSHKTEDSLKYVTPNQPSKSSDESIPAKDYSRKPANNNVKLHTVLEDKNIITSPSLKTNKNCVVEIEHQDEDVRGKTAASKSQKNICNICSFVSTYHKDLVRHMRKHTGEKPYLCSICGKKFARQDKLTSHKRIHIGDKRYKCTMCEYATTDSGALRKHSQIHTDERPHRCQMCSYRARNSSHMTVHLRTHTGDSPFFCQFGGCERTFKTSTDLKRHLKIHRPSLDVPLHEDIMKRKRGINRRRGVLACVQRHKCSECNASFVRQDSLRSHLKLHSHLAQDLKCCESLESPKPSLVLSADTPPALLLSSQIQDPQTTDNFFYNLR